jgi:hypothetical protein
MGRKSMALTRLLTPDPTEGTFLRLARRYRRERGQDPPTIARWRSNRK